MTSFAANLLLIEDSAADAALLRAAIASTPYGPFALKWVTRLSGGLRELAAGGYDLVLLDPGLPDSQGLETLAAVRGAAPQTPIVLLTGYDDQDFAVQSLKEGAQDYLVKGEALGDQVPRAIRYAIERQRASEMLAETEMRLQMAVEASGIGIIEQDWPSQRMIWSKEMEKIVGVDAFDGSFETFLTLVHPDDRPAVSAKLRQPENASPVFHHEHRMIRPDGHARWVYVCGRLLDEPQGRRRKSLCAVIDITDRKLAEERARQRDAELAHVSRISTLGQVAAELIHELNQPLSAILNYASVCSEQLQRRGGRVEATLKSGIDEILHETRRSRDIVNRMRVFVKNQRPTTAPVNPGELVQRAIALIEYALRQQRIAPKLALDLRAPPVEADSLQIEQVLINLIVNAIHAMNELPAGERSLCLQTLWLEQQAMVQFSVIDGGKGATAEQMERFFEPFFTTKPDGLGLGLSISRAIIENHGGALSAAANAGRGMTFRFTLPPSGTP